MGDHKRLLRSRAMRSKPSPLLLLLLPLLLLVLLLFIATTHALTVRDIDTIFSTAHLAYHRVYLQWSHDAVTRSQFPTYGRWQDAYWRNDTVAHGSWTCGFLAGVLWKLYEHETLVAATANRHRQRETTAVEPPLLASSVWLAAAQETTVAVAAFAERRDTHDVGFVISSSFGNGLTLTNNRSYVPVLLTAAASLSSRFNAQVGCTRSWDSDAGFLVIIDNMMNLELLNQAAKLESNSTRAALYSQQAFLHANRTMHEHFRSNHSTFHVVEYNETSGHVLRRYTAQGFADYSTWARGQAWATYGFVQSFQRTSHREFLQTAIEAAKLFLRLCFAFDQKDVTPIWDFDAPSSKYQPRDASSAAIMASAALELSEILIVENATLSAYFRESAVTLLEHLIEHHANNATGSIALPSLMINATIGPYHASPQDAPFDVSLPYADMFFLEALLRLRRLLLS